MTAPQPLIVDIHTHVYLPSYMDMLRKRTEIPLVHSSNGEEKIILLKEEANHDGGSNSAGRPIGPQYWEVNEKLHFMDLHGIDVSVVSLANPWLDFLEPTEAEEVALAFNEDLQVYCSNAPLISTSEGSPKSRLYAFGSLPLVPGITLEAVSKVIDQISSLSYLRGVVMGTKGLGKGLDDPEMEKVWEKLAERGLMSFVHPHYGIEGAFGTQDNGHVLPLALGFPFETTIAIARLILAGVLDRHPTLPLLLAHSAGALPALSSRLASCVIHDPTVKDRLSHDFRYYLGLLWYDSVAYGTEELSLVERVVARSRGFEGRDEEFVSRQTTRPNILAPTGIYPRTERILFGTDHPFFPPLNGETRWKSVDENLNAIDNVPGWTDEDKNKVLGGNAVRIFGLLD